MQSRCDYRLPSQSANIFNLFGETAQGMVGMQLVEGYKPSMFPISIFLPHSVPKGKASLNLKRTLWGDKTEGLLPENCPNFSFFFVWAG
jgi:hypothetical protein